jgi:DNA-binding XRE family transcriptional regulator
MGNNAMTSTQKSTPAKSAERALVLTKAVVRAGDALGLKSAELANVIGVSPATMSRMRNGEYVLEEGGKAFELSALLVRFFRSLDAIAGGDKTVRAAWLRNENIALGGVPAKLIQTVAGLTDGLAYLDARRAPI